MPDTAPSLPFTSEQIEAALLKRHSTRRFDGEPFSQETLSQAVAFAGSVEPLCQENQFDCLVKSTQEINIKEVVGAYGNIINPPHFLAPYLIGERYPLTDLGYRAAQMVIFLTAAGISTCFIGTIAHQKEACQMLALPPGSVFGAAVLIGKPGHGFTNQTIESLIHNFSTGDKRLPLEAIFFDQYFDYPQMPPEEIAHLIRFARRSPSAVNAQPWRFLLRDRLYLFATRQNPRYGKNFDYRYYDAGICMAHIHLAMRAAGKEHHWELLPPDTPGLPEHPAELEPIARLNM